MIMMKTMLWSSLRPFFLINFRYCSFSRVTKRIYENIEKGMECHEIESEVFSKDRRLATTIPKIDLHQYRPAGTPGEPAAVVIVKVGEDKTVQSK